jgi:hypothetical protein
MRVIGIALTLVLVTNQSIADPAPAGWRLSVTPEDGVVAGIDSGVFHQGRRSAVLARTAGEDGIVSLRQSFRPDSLRGKRIRLTAWGRTQDIENRAFIWLRVDGKEIEDILAFDNMWDRPLQGTSDWSRYEIVVDVAPQASSVIFGAYLMGKGALWVDDFVIEPVGQDVVVTDAVAIRESMPRDQAVPDSVRSARNRSIAESPATPRNLSFEE